MCDLKKYYVEMQCVITVKVGLKTVHYHCKHLYYATIFFPNIPMFINFANDYMPEPRALNNRPPDLTGVIMLERFEPYKPPLLFIIIINYIPFFLCVYSPNVCGMRFYSYCCPGWRLHPRTKQCVVRKYYLFSSVFH